jgi:hypothetical protein
MPWITRQSLGGLTYRVFVSEVLMPAIEPTLLNCSFFVYPNKVAAENGERTGGSGFFVRMQAAVDPYWHLYAVTNDHVIRRNPTPYLRVNTHGPAFDTIPTNREWWTRSPADDLAVLSITLDPEHAWNAVNIDDFVTRERMQKMTGLPIGPGDDVAMIGRFISHAGVARNKPTVRFGNIAMSADPFEPVEIGTDADGNPVMQEAFLVECRSLGGFSGSPVLVYPSTHRGRFTFESTIGPYLLGVDCAHVATWKPVCQSKGPTTAISNMWVDTNSGISAVIPAWRLRTILEQEPFVSQRKKDDEELQQKQPAEVTAIPDLSVESDEEKPPASFTRADFEAALKKVSRRLSDEEKSET